MIIKDSPICGSGAAPPPAATTLLPSIVSTITHPEPLPDESAGQLTQCGFEGPEKLFEIWFRPVNGKDTDEAFGELETPTHAYPNGAFTDDTGKWHYRRTGLRTVPRGVWEEMLSIVQCQVLNVIENESVTAYLLSESSMFVYPNRLMLKTCGTTTLLHAVSRILEIAAEHCGFHDVNAVFYSRKAFLYPEKQAWPHGRWSDEVGYLDKMFPNDTYETSGYVLGNINGDHWCLYMCTPLGAGLDLDGVELSDTSSSRSGESSDGEGSAPEDDEDEDDVTLEILMTNLDPEAMKPFWRTVHELRAAKEEGGERVLKEGAERVYRETGISHIYPNAKVDHYLFDPCGYSLNGLLGPYYFTIHVTPESICSYASFETTIPVKDFYRRLRPGSESEFNSFDDVVSRVIDVFRPGRFSTTLFTRRTAGQKHHAVGGLLDGNIKGFRRRDRIAQSLGKWDLVFSHYDRARVAAKKVGKGKNLAAR
ncbi:spermidine resistance protein [Rhizophlyctis rosea]|nr:spermidine resistance protein [Rhizophlyctis rosea]